MITLTEIQSLQPELLAQQDTQAIADTLSAGRVKLEPTEIGNGLVLATIGLEAGNALLDAIYNTPDFRYVKPLLEQGRLDISTELSRGSLDVLAQAQVITQEQADAIKALAERPDPVSEFEVRCLCWSVTGEWMV